MVHNYDSRQHLSVPLRFPGLERNKSHKNKCLSLLLFNLCNGPFLQRNRLDSELNETKHCHEILTLDSTGTGGKFRIWHIAVNSNIQAIPSFEKKILRKVEDHKYTSQPTLETTLLIHAQIYHAICSLNVHYFKHAKIRQNRLSVITKEISMMLLFVKDYINFLVIHNQNKKDPSSYRPIALLPVYSKIFEDALYKETSWHTD